MSTSLKVKLLRPEGRVPNIQNPGSAGYDLHSAKNIILQPGERKMIEIGIALEIPEGTYGRIAPRSGLSVKNHIDVKAGVVDSNYRGEISVVLKNDHPKESFEIKVGDRIAQLILEKIITPEIEIVDRLGDTVRGEGGFGSTGK